MAKAISIFTSEGGKARVTTFIRPYKKAANRSAVQTIGYNFGTICPKEKQAAAVENTVAA